MKKNFQLLSELGRTYTKCYDVHHLPVYIWIGCATYSHSIQLHSHNYNDETGEYPPVNPDNCFELTKDILRNLIYSTIV